MSSFTYMTTRAAVLGVQTTSDFGDVEIRSQETFGLPLGAEFRIPVDLTDKVHWETFPNARIDPDTGKKKQTPYLILKQEGMKDDEENSGIRFYPSTLVKMAIETTDEGVRTGKIIRAKGTAVDIFKQYHRMQDGINALAGKVLKVTSEQNVTTLRFGSNTQTHTVRIPTIDIVEEQPDSTKPAARPRRRSSK